MSVLDSGKPYDELTDAEMAELETRDWSAGEIQRAIGLALREGEMGAVIELLRRLAIKDPKAAAAILAVIEAS